MDEITQKAIQRIQFAYETADSRNESLIVAYSGGKDSDVLLDLAVKSDVHFVAEHNHTTVDAPATVYHIREVFSKLESRGIPTKINNPDISMWELIAKKLMPPTRIARYCCEYLKERWFENQQIMTGVRWSESFNRSKRGFHEVLSKNKEKRIVYVDENDDKRRLIEMCQMHKRIAHNPIIDWSDKNIWEYIRSNDMKTNPLYEQRFRRVGCIGCPMAGSKGQLREFSMFPKYKRMYIRAFEKMLENRKNRELYINEQWKDGESVFRWWTDPNFNVNQLTLELE